MSLDRRLPQLPLANVATGDSLLVWNLAAAPENTGASLEADRLRDRPVYVEIYWSTRGCRSNRLRSWEKWIPQPEQIVRVCGICTYCFYKPEIANLTIARSSRTLPLSRPAPELCPTGVGVFPFSYFQDTFMGFDFRTRLLPCHSPAYKSALVLGSALHPNAPPLDELAFQVGTLIAISETGVVRAPTLVGGRIAMRISSVAMARWRQSSLAIADARRGAFAPGCSQGTHESQIHVAG